MRIIMVLNLGSTSFKFKLFDMDRGEDLLATGSVDAINSDRSRVRISSDKGIHSDETVCPDHDSAFHLCMEHLIDSKILLKIGDLAAIGYKAVMGGSLTGAQMVTESLISVMEQLSTLAPAHNPIYVRMMKQIAVSEPQLKQYACFETGFHTSIPMKRAVYGAPNEWLEWGIRKYGYHGASHSYIAQTVRERYPAAKRIVSIHLGGSSSICAILDGKSVFSTMGATPQSGLFHNNRIGDFDIFCLPLLLEHYHDTKEILDVLSKKSGFLGLSGVSNDMREIEKEVSLGNKNATLALDAFCDEITGYIGMCSAYMGGLDTIVFTGGIGEHSSQTRKRSTEILGYLGVELDDMANEENRPVISTINSRVRVLVMETNEEIMIARQVAKCLDQ